MAQSTPTSALGFQDFFTTTLDGSITASDTTISLANAPTPTMGYLVIEPDSSTNREIIMYTSVSGNDVICGSVDDRGIGGTTARAHSSGAIVKMNTVSDMFEALQSGTGLATGAITVAKIGAGAVTNAKLSTTAGEPGGAWTTWSPTTTGITAGDGVQTARYSQVGKTVNFVYRFVLGSTSDITAGVTITLPVTPHAGFAVDESPIGWGHLSNAATKQYPAVLAYETTGPTTVVRRLVADEAHLYSTPSTSTLPFDFAVGDELFFTGTYEAA